MPKFQVDMDQLIDQIRHLDAEQLREVQEEVSLRRTRLSRLAVRSFQIGDLVKFTGRNNRVVKGVVHDVKRKYIHVRDTNSGTIWRVPGNMLVAQ